MQPGSALLLTGLFLGSATAIAAPSDNRVRLSIFSQDVGSLDPDFAVGSQDRIAVSWIFSALVRFKPGSTDPALIEPDLAQSWESSPDKLTWTFHLRHGVQFQGGFGEFTSDDVLFSLKKAADPKTSAFSADFTAIDKVEAVDPYTVRITLKQQVPSLLGMLTNYSGGFILSKKAYERRGAEFARNPVGTGPFAIQAITPNQAAEFTANASYFRGKPKLAGIVYRFMPSGASRDLAFQTGELDVNDGQQDQAWINRTRQIPHTIVDVMEPAELSQLSLNVTAKPLDDIRVRQAIAYAINRPELVRWRGTDVSREPQSVIPRGYLGFSPDVGLLPNDVAKAKALLAEAGYPNGLTIKMIHTQNPDMLAAMQVVQAELKKAGINVDLQVVEHATYHQMIRQDLSPMVFYAAARFPVADVYLTQFFDSHSIVKTPTAVTNFSHCTVADADIAAARKETDPQKQIADWVDAQKKIVADVCAVPLIETLQIWARHDDFDYGYDNKGAMSTGPLITEASHFK
ncbi:MAG TPA: ABC transporter substrate-binding protein [Acetobacteraceae bacterium]|jgi:peptide/nickel transport system substrate-binding protein|nr:ABC transporter substrate-binding protein [Acetobacteraceae bacterium]